jgi:Ca2+-binding RTX toxin-like protein
VAYARITTSDIITIREGQTRSLNLDLVGLYNHQVTWSYYTTVSGGSAQNSDIGGASGSGSMMIVSSFPTTESEPFSISALRDDVKEEVETAYLVVQVSGSWGFAFEDGSTSKIIEIRIIDDNLTTGGVGDDILRGTGGAEDLVGGAGNDTYHLSPGDHVVELADEGQDTVYSSITHVLGDNVEDLTLIGNAAVNATGNLLGNRLTGNGAANLIAGNTGLDRLFGGGGGDTLSGGLDNDLLEGGNGNDWLDGGQGIDTLLGGAGDDVFILDNRADIATELASQGTDTVRTVFGTTLGSYLENLTLLGTEDVSGKGNALHNVLTGNAGANRLHGEAGNDTVSGGTGNDWLDGGTGVDQLRGGVGDDTYVIDNIGDRVFEGKGQGIDAVRSKLSFQLSGNVENLVLTGNAAIDGTGNALNNTLTGNAWANLLTGGAGNDVLNGGRGRDSLFGGKGADQLSGGLDAVRDVFIFKAVSDSTPGAGRDRILDFRAGVDDIDLHDIDANMRSAGNQTFDFSGKTAAAHSVWYVKTGANLIVRADVNGDRVADLEIAVLGHNALSAGDFLL